MIYFSKIKSCVISMYLQGKKIIDLKIYIDQTNVFDVGLKPVPAPQFCRPSLCQSVLYFNHQLFMGYTMSVVKFPAGECKCSLISSITGSFKKNKVFIFVQYFIKNFDSKYGNSIVSFLVFCYHNCSMRKICSSQAQFKCNFEFFQGNEAKKSQSRKKFANSKPPEKFKLHQN